MRHSDGEGAWLGLLAVTLGEGRPSTWSIFTRERARLDSQDTLLADVMLGMMSVRSCVVVAPN